TPRGEANTLVVAVSPDGTRLAFASANVLQVFDVETGNEVSKVLGLRTGPVGLLFSPDGRVLAARTMDGGATLWEATTGREVQELGAPPRPQNRRPVAEVALHAGDTPCMAFSPDGKSLAVATTEIKQPTLSSAVR